MLPGEPTLASAGGPYLDDIGEFLQSTVEALRDSLADGVVTIARGSRSRRWHPRFSSERLDDARIDIVQALVGRRAHRHGAHGESAGA